MEVQPVVGEVRYSIKIPNLPSYKDEKQLFQLDFSLSLNGLRTRWRLTINPFLTNKHDAHIINRDIGISLACLWSSITKPDIDIYCSVVGRGEEHEKKLENKHKQDVNAIWSGVMVSRMALHVLNLLPGGHLTANLRFVIRGGEVWENPDPLEELSAQLRELRNGKYSDIEIHTTDGVRIPAHTAILHVRSSLLQRTSGDTMWKERRPRDMGGERTHQDIPESQFTPDKNTRGPKIETNRSETPMSTTFESDLSSGYHSISSDSSTSSSQLMPGKVTLGSVAHTSSPRRYRSPSKILQLTGDKGTISPYMISPNKRLTSPNRIIAQCENYLPRQRVTSHPKKRQISCHPEEPTSTSTSEKIPMKEITTPQTPPSAGHILKVNMTASVAEHMLDWIYTGECGELGRLARPLLVGGTRHGVGGLVKACEQHLAASLTPSSAPSTLLLAHKYSASTLLSSALKYAVMQAREVTSQPSWSTLASHAPTLMTDFSRLLALHTHPDPGR